MPYPLFDRSRLRLRPLAERHHDMSSAQVMELDAPADWSHPDLAPLAAAVATARDRGRPVIFLYGAHVLKVGLQRFVIDLLARGWISHLATNGAGLIHDWELALCGATTESVARYIKDGQFGLWQETGELNDVIAAGHSAGLGYGEAVGQAILSRRLPHAELSVAAAAVECGVPLTAHVGLGYDITHEHPNCDGAALGGASYRDFLAFAHTVSQLEGGVFLCFGSAVMGPEVYLKALAMARNVADQDGQTIAHFTTAVFDLQDLGEDLSAEAPKSDPRYYYRPFKTILLRTVADGGTSYYLRGPHERTLPALRAALLARRSV